jgi:hypothetical protein
MEGIDRLDCAAPDLTPADQRVVLHRARAEEVDPAVRAGLMAAFRERRTPSPHPGRRPRRRRVIPLPAQPGPSSGRGSTSSNQKNPWPARVTK